MGFAGVNEPLQLFLKVSAGATKIPAMQSFSGLDAVGTNRPRIDTDAKHGRRAAANFSAGGPNGSHGMGHGIPAGLTFFVAAGDGH